MPSPLRNKTYLILLFLSLTLIGWFGAGCSKITLPAEATPTLVPSATPTLAPTASPTASPTPTPLPPLLVLLVPPEADQALAEFLEATFAGIAQQEGLRWQVRPSLSPAEAASEVNYVIAVPPVEGLNELVAAAEGTKFLAVGISGLEPAANLIAIGTEGEKPDQQGFLAGYIAAMITPQWRVGVISVEDTPEGQAARIGFLNGVAYFCGLCRPSSPPFYEYPLFIGLPEGASEAEWLALADFMVDRFVKTVYVVPGAEKEAVFQRLAQAGIQIIGSVSPPDSLKPQWVVSIRQEVDRYYTEYWPNLFSGETGNFFPSPLQFKDINSEIFTPGKQMNAEEILADLQAGYIATGAEPNLSTDTP